MGSGATWRTDASPPLRHARLWNGIGIGFVLLVVGLSLAPAPAELDAPDIFDLGHVLAYFWLMIWFAQIHRGSARRWLLAAAFGALGVGLEYLQALTGYRRFDYLDMARNVAGIAIGLASARSSLQNALYRLERLLARFDR